MYKTHAVYSAKLQKAKRGKMRVWRVRRNASSFLSVRLLLCVEQLGSHWADFHEI